MQTRHTPQARSAGFAGQLDIVSEELSHMSLPLSLIEMPVKHGHKAAMHSGSSVRVAVLMCSLTEQFNDGYPAKQLGVDDELLCLLPIRAHLGVGDARVGSRVSPSLTSTAAWPHWSPVARDCSCHPPFRRYAAFPGILYVGLLVQPVHLHHLHLVYAPRGNANFLA